MKVFLNESLCGYYKLLWSKCKETIFLKKKRLRLEKITNGAVKIKSLNDQVLSTTGSVQPSSLWVQNSYPQN